MKLTTLIATLLAFVATISLSNAASLHRARRQLVPAEFRNINIENYLKNPRSVLFQLKCIVYDGPCDKIGKYLKVTIPELITGTCQHCSASDRQTAGRLVAHIQKNYPKEWHDAIKKYQGGQSVKPEDAKKFESILGVKIESEFVSSTVAPPPAEVSSTSTTNPPTTTSVVTTAVPALSPVVPEIQQVSSSSAPPVALETKPVVVVSATPTSAPTPVTVVVTAVQPVVQAAPAAATPVPVQIAQVPAVPVEIAASTPAAKPAHVAAALATPATPIQSASPPAPSVQTVVVAKQPTEVKGQPVATVVQLVEQASRVEDTAALPNISATTV